MGTTKSKVFYSYGEHHMQGRRESMEDASLTIPCLGGDNYKAMFGVFDGHNGAACANFVKDHLGM